MALSSYPLGLRPLGQNTPQSSLYQESTSVEKSVMRRTRRLPEVAVFHTQLLRIRGADEMEDS